jgi:tetratricopeptide (TPR) repeat protein
VEEGEGVSLFSPATLDGLRAAAEEARAAGDEEAQRVCETVFEAVSLCDGDQRERARGVMDDAMARTTDLRLLFLGYQFHFRCGRLDEAEALIRRRLEVAPAESAEAARAWNNLGLLLHFRGDRAGAEAMLTRALKMNRRIGCAEGEARDLCNLGLVPEAAGELERAAGLYKEALAVAERAGFLPVAASALANLGDIAHARGERGEARACWERAVGLFWKLGDSVHREEFSAKLAGLEGGA